MTADERAQKRSKDFTGMLWHIVTFLVVNGLLWALDIAGGGGVDWAFWLTIFWGIALVFHIAWYFIDVANSGKRYERFLADEQRKSAE